MSVLQLNRPSTQDVAEVIRRLCAAFKRPYKADMEAMVAEWHRSLAARFGRDDLQDAVNRCADNDPEFPSLAKFRAHCFDVERARQPERSSLTLKQQYDAWFVDPWRDDVGSELISKPCPVCGTVVEVTARGYVSVHDDDQHTRARVGFTNLGHVEWRSMGPMEELPPKRRAAALPALADVVMSEPVQAKIQRAVTKHPEHVMWDDVPLPEPPPDALLAVR